MRWLLFLPLAGLCACEVPSSAGPPPGVPPTPLPSWGDRLTLGQEVVCSESGDALPGYQDVTEAMGVDFEPVLPEWDEGDNGVTSIMLEGVGGFGVADLDGDGWLDLVFTSFADVPKVYRATGPLRYEPVLPQDHGIDNAGVHTNAVTAVDVDGDGDLDLQFGTVDGVRAYRNEGDFVFTDVTAASGMDVTAGNNVLGLAWADVDVDGDPDPYVLGYGPGSPGPGLTFENDPDFLFENDDGTFIERTGAILPPDASNGQSFGGGWFDGDGDGLMDLYVVNDNGGFDGNPGNLYFRNLGGWVFENLDLGADVAMLAMGLALGDMDNDGDIDAHISNAGPTVLLRNEGEHLFTDVSLPLRDFSDGSAGDISWGTTFVDVDNDGVLELMTAFGHMPTKEGQGPNQTQNREAMPDQLWTQTPDGWRDVASDLGVADPAWSRTVLAEDLDRDGFAELITWSLNAGPRVHRSGCNGNAWLRVHLEDTRGANLAAIGARIEAVGDGTPFVVMEVQAGGEGTLSGGAPEARLGLAQADEVDLTVRWPDGETETFERVPTRRSVTIRR
ncbi:MAG: CRTAC1 family protein [Deltaproteobacteria bacterium]|nr:CRTAC1 family protein [Deltaproteobacteria bacterium]